MSEEAGKPLPCPFCGEEPVVEPLEPQYEGNVWATVQCVYRQCPTFAASRFGGHGVQVHDGEEFADDRGSDAYKQAAIRRWNQRA